MGLIPVKAVSGFLLSVTTSALPLCEMSKKGIKTISVVAWEAA